MPLILALDNSSRTFRPLTPSQISCHERGSTGCVPHVCLSPTLPVALAEPAGLWCFSLPGQPYFLVSRECCLPFRQCYFFTGGHSQVHQIPQGAEVASPPFLWHRAVLKQCYLWLGILQTFGEAALWVFTVWLPALHQLDMKATEWERMAGRFSPRTNPLSYSRIPSSFWQSPLSWDWISPFLTWMISQETSRASTRTFFQVSPQVHSISLSLLAVGSSQTQAKIPTKWGFPLVLV